MKLAYFSPFNPQPSGISDYSEELLPYLSQYASIDLFVDGFRPSNNSLLETFSVFDYQHDQSLLNRLNDYDATLYHMGNDHRYHAGMVEVMRRHAGIVVFHDYALQDFFLGLARERGTASIYLDELQACNGQQQRELAAEAFERGATPSQAASPLEFPLNCRLARNAEGIIVHSEWSRQRFEEVAPHVPVVRVNHHITARAAAGPKDRPKRSAAINIASFGLVTPEKGIDRALKALASLRHEFDFVYKLVGPANNFPDLDQLIARYGLGDRVSVIGAVSLEDFERHIAETDIAINLRERPVGATSGSLCRIMAAGVPAIVSDVGAFSELPDSIVIKIDNNEYADALLRAYLKELMANGRLREQIGANARAHVLTEHRIEDSAARYIAFIQQVIDGRTRRAFLNDVTTQLSQLSIQPRDENVLASIAADVAVLAPSLDLGPPAPVLMPEPASTSGNGHKPSPPKESEGRLAKIEGVDFKRAAVEYPQMLDAERFHYLFTKPFYNLANKPAKHTGDGMDVETFRHFCDFANVAVALALPAGSRILDVGCGSGWLSEYFARLGYDVTGIDISPKLIEISRERLAALSYGVDHETPLRCRFQVHDIESAPLKEKFDAIICYDSLHHLENEREVFRHLSHMLEVGGLLFILEGQKPETGSATEEELRGVMRQFGTLESPFSYNYLRSLARENGFAIVGDYISVNGLFEREMLQADSLPLMTLDTNYNYLIGMKVVPQGSAENVPDSRAPGNLKVKFALRAEPAKVVSPGALISIPITIKNVGDTLWLTGQTVRAGIVMPAVTIHDDTGKVVEEFHGCPMLPRAVAPGQSMPLQVEFHAPSVPGSYSIKVDVVDQHICWFEERGSQPLIFKLRVHNP